MATAFPPIMVKEMDAKLLKLDDVFTLLKATEPIGQYGFPTGAGFHLALDPGWAEYADTISGDDPVAAKVSIGIGAAATEFPLTKDALLQVTSACGLPKTYAMRTPAHLIEPHVNYWLGKGGGMGNKEYQLLTMGKGDDLVGAALTRPSIQPYSNVRLLEEVVEAVKVKYGRGVEKDLRVDYKLTHSIDQTRIRLIVPEATRQMRSHREDDFWSAGVQLSNSLTGRTMTAAEGYLFAWWCTNGSTNQHTSTGSWTRKGSHTPEELYDWARVTVDGILGGLEDSFDAVQALTEVDLTTDVSMTLRDLYREYGVPLASRERITDSMVDSDSMTMYALMAAVTSAANTEGISDGQVDDLLRIGGILPEAAVGRCPGCKRLLPGGLHAHTH